MKFEKVSFDQYYKDVIKEIDMDVLSDEERTAVYEDAKRV